MRGFYILSALLLLSCGRSSIIDSAAVKYEKPGKVVSLDADTTFSRDFHEVLNCLNLQIINDSILIIQDQVNETNTTHFKAYSTKSFEYLGALIHNGRGADEMLSPSIVKVVSSEEDLYLKTASSPNVYRLDVLNSLTSRHVMIAEEFVLPSNRVDWIPLRDSVHFIMNYEDREFVFHTVDDQGIKTGTFNVFEGIDAGRNATHLSLFMVSGNASGKVAIPMIFSPVLCMLDTDSGEMYTIAVDKGYRKWESVINRPLDLNTIQYYTGAAASEDYIFAAYRELPLGKLRETGYGSSIHVFDWDGKFIYDIKVKENIEQMTFDNRTKCLYCIEKTKGIVIRYNMNELI